MICYSVVDAFDVSSVSATDGPKKFDSKYQYIVQKWIETLDCWSFVDAVARRNLKKANEIWDDLDVAEDGRRYYVYVGRPANEFYCGMSTTQISTTGDPCRFTTHLTKAKGKLAAKIQSQKNKNFHECLGQQPIALVNHISQSKFQNSDLL
ncbi:hypothetical protein GEMRC1_012177 [Eukaryota sp. GEM-RC1]